MTLIIDFQVLRDAWALKAPNLAKEDLDSQLRMDLGLNPHNDHYKPDRRSASQIVSDSAYKFADSVLTKQYGVTYTTWLTDQGYRDDPNYRGWHLVGSGSAHGHSVVHPSTVAGGDR